MKLPSYANLLKLKSASHANHFPLWCYVVFANYYTHYHCDCNTEVTILWADASGEICQEKKVLYKLISGLHSSISIHIAADYLLDETKNLVSSQFIYSMFSYGLPKNG